MDVNRVGILGINGLILSISDTHKTKPALKWMFSRRFFVIYTEGVLKTQ